MKFIFTAVCTENPFTQLETLHQITPLQTTLGRVGDNSPNVVPWTETFVTEIFSYKMN